MRISPNSKNAISKFKHLFTENISSNKADGQISLFLLPINSRQFDYNAVENCLLESIVDYALSWKIRNKYKSKPMITSKKAREKYREYKRNTGELGELLLFCFLEGHLGAPKILTKLELKTSNNMYVNGSDGIHLLRIAQNEYQLIFGEAKTYKNVSDGMNAAFKSISNFYNEVNDNGEKSNGIRFEKGLISDKLDEWDEYDLDESDIKVVKALTYPNACVDDINIDDAFAIFIGYEINIENERINLDNTQFKKKIENKVRTDIENKKADIYRKIKEYDLVGHSFYVYVLPFTDIDNTRKNMLKGMLE